MADNKSKARKKPVVAEFQALRGVTLKPRYDVNLVCQGCGVFRNEKTGMSQARDAQREAISQQGMVTYNGGIYCPGRCVTKAAEEG